jgi:RecA/RadA recombinase
MDFLKQIKKTLNNEYASIVDEGIPTGDITGFIDTGSYAFNALLSGNLFGGLPNNKITVLAGETSVGKTYLCLSILKNFLDQDPKAMAIYYESESALTKEMFIERGIDTKRVLIVPVQTVQEFRHQVLLVLDNYEKLPQKDRNPLLLIIDSLGNLSTTKEMEDSLEGKETADMTRARLIKSAFRTITLKLGKVGAALLATNHTYDEQGLFPRKVMSGGSGPQYNASLTVFLSRRKEKDGTEVIGNVITARLEKARITKENSKVELFLSYKKGLHRYYGLLDLALKYGLVEKIGNKYKFAGDDKTYFEKQIYKKPEEFFTQEFLEKLNVCAEKEFCYGNLLEEDDTLNE